VSLSDIRSKLETALSALGISYSGHIPSVVNPPMVICGLQPNNAVSYDTTFQNASLIYHFYAEVVVNKGATLESAQDELDDYLLPAGTTSIKAALESITWGASTADCCRVTGVNNYGPVTYGGSEFLGARLTLDIWRSS